VAVGGSYARWQLCSSEEVERHCTLMIRSVKLGTFRILWKILEKQIVICDLVSSLYYVPFFLSEFTYYIIEMEVAYS
jgi:hypothetical protein